jgi:prepilin-type N-terminal cleavage/methylation domain-containing protein
MRQNPKTSQSQAGRCGVTLIELLVTITVAVVIMGLALAIMVESDKATRKITRSQSVVQYCQQVMDQACGTVRGAVAPANLSLPQQPERLIPRFAKNELRVAAFGQGPGMHLCQVTISTEGTEKHPTRIKRVSNPLAPDTATTGSAAAASRVDSLGGVQLDHFSPSIKFGYAGTIEPGKMPVFEDSWTSQGWPALIQITVRGRLDEDSNNPIELQTAVIPGIMPEKTRPATANANTSHTISTAPLPAGKPTAQSGPIAKAKEAQG